MSCCPKNPAVMGSTSTSTAADADVSEVHKPAELTETVHVIWFAVGRDADDRTKHD